MYLSHQQSQIFEATSSWNAFNEIHKTNISMGLSLKITSFKSFFKTVSVIVLLSHTLTTASEMADGCPSMCLSMPRGHCSRLIKKLGSNLFMANWQSQKKYYKANENYQID